jgi:uncharacterized membrane-anchored protein YitT (DUF2179 family)
MDTESTHSWCTVNHMKLNDSETRIYFFCYKNEYQMNSFFKFVDLIFITEILLKKWKSFMVQNFIFANTWTVCFHKLWSCCVLFMIWPFKLLINLLVLIFYWKRIKLKYAFVTWNTLNCMKCFKFYGHQQALTYSAEGVSPVLVTSFLKSIMVTWML